LPVVLYGCETWLLILREKHRLRLFESRVLKQIFRPKKDGVTQDWRRLLNEELYDLHSSPNIVSGDQIKKNEMIRTRGTYGR